MSLRRIPKWTPIAKPMIGMLHIPPLPGSPRFNGNMDSVIVSVLRDAATLVEAGIHGLLLENYGDAPFYSGQVPAHTVAQMTRLALQVRSRFEVPLGINVLRNDGQGALAIAQAVNACFVRVNVLCGVSITDQGIIQGIAHELLRDRANLDATHIDILADIDVKHSAAIVSRSIEDEVHDTILRGGADGLIVSGNTTGQTVDVEHLNAVRSAAKEIPVLVGSGLSVEELEQYWPLADGFIVGTSLKRDGIVTNSVDVARVAELMEEHTRLAEQVMR